LVSALLTYDAAGQIAGELFGNLLGRNSDQAGYAYAVDGLISGQKSPRMLVKEFCTSEEFRERHMMNQTPNEFARQAQLRLLGQKRLDPDLTKRIATRLLEEDWRCVVGDLIDCAEYGAAHGNKIPLWA
jgi:hypothetical protein